MPGAAQRWRSVRAVTEAALGAYRALGCSGFSRVDLILGEEGPLVLEVNAIPGLTDTSLLPQAAEAAGISFEELVGHVLRPRARFWKAARLSGQSLPWAKSSGLTSSRNS